MKKILFILKKRDNNYQSDTYSMKGGLSSGLFNSVKFVNDMLIENGFDSSYVEVDDNNSIDREVHKLRPDIVIIEAIWVIPSKFEILRKLHPNVHWIIRIHSEIPFIANEGIALGWLFGYAGEPNVTIAANTERMQHDLKQMLLAKYSHEYLADKVIYLPNYYRLSAALHKQHHKTLPTTEINIGCFGAIRPLKNQLIQALAAIEYAKSHNKILKFHINSSRIEHGNNVLKNIKNLFEALDPLKYQLVEHPWLHHHEFLKLVNTMNVCLQVSFSETFNIVAADAVSQDIPIVASKEISWLSDMAFANTTSTKSISHAIHLVLQHEPDVIIKNRRKLNTFNQNSTAAWLEYLR